MSQEQEDDRLLIIYIKSTMECSEAMAEKVLGAYREYSDVDFISFVLGVLAGLSI